jgi:phosphodiester glycosidase
MRHTRTIALLAALVVAAACARLVALRSEPLVLPRLSFSVDSARTQQLAPGAAYHFVYTKSGPWAIHVLDLDRTSCWTPIVVKGTPGAAGRARTSEILRKFANEQLSTHPVIGGVNGDFFALGTGVPVSAYVGYSRLVAGPADRPVFALDSSRALRIATLRTDGWVTIRGARYPLESWNRLSPRGLALFDDGYGVRTDSGSGNIEVRLAGSAPLAVELVDTASSGLSIASQGHVLVAGAQAPAPVRQQLLSLTRGDTLRVGVTLAPFFPLEAVGGYPVIVRDSAETGDLDNAGQETFRARNPRSAIGITRNGRRFLLVAVDGRQQPYSDGMTLHELAKLMLDLGATQALNLDGGGSTTLVYSDPDSSGRLRIANHPSDRDGERPVGNAIAIMKECVGQ